MGSTTELEANPVLISLEDKESRVYFNFVEEVDDWHNGVMRRLPVWDDFEGKLKLEELEKKLEKM